MNNLELLKNTYNDENYNITIDTCYSKVLNYIIDNNIKILNYEESMKETYLKMIKDGYKFLFNRDIITDILIDIAYAIEPKDELNSIMVKNTLGSIECDSEDTDSDDDNNNEELNQNNLMKMMNNMMNPNMMNPNMMNKKKE